MTERERLIRLLNNSLTGSVGLSSMLSENIADYLLANGVIVSPYEIKDTACAITKDEFMQELSNELVQGFSSTNNAAVLCTAISNEETCNLDLTAHINGTYCGVSSIMEFLVKQYLKPLDDELVKSAGDVLIEIINKEQERSQSQKGEVEHGKK